MADRGAQVIRVVVLAARLAVGGVFAYAGWVKARDPGQFIRDLWGFRLLPEDAAYWIAAYAPYLEIVAGLALITGIQRRGAHLLLIAMLVVFIASLATAWARGLDVSCGCFGSGSAAARGATHGLLWPITRDVLLLAGVALSARFNNRSHAQPSQRPAL
jgi:uncharacterized membrane protein YphA (DoxX/SURF4 family)